MPVRKGGGYVGLLGALVATCQQQHKALSGLGVIHAVARPKVDVVTADAVTDEKKGSYYPATLTLASKDMLIDGKRIALSPGMNITAEIKTGKRRIIEYLLSPVQRAGSESLRER